ncbi:MAG TPA: hypothetical protein VHK24_00905, partial [Steroidobacter sp.]|nr:hypothetical protein [Steroidobacter sp.]
HGTGPATVRISEKSTLEFQTRVNASREAREAAEGAPIKTRAHTAATTQRPCFGDAFLRQLTIARFPMRENQAAIFRRAPCQLASIQAVFLTPKRSSPPSAGVRSLPSD